MKVIVSSTFTIPYLHKSFKSGDNLILRRGFKRGLKLKFFPIVGALESIETCDIKSCNYEKLSRHGCCRLLIKFFGFYTSDGQYFAHINMNRGVCLYKVDSLRVATPKEYDGLKLKHAACQL